MVPNWSRVWKLPRTLVTDVEKRLKTANQREIAKVWLDEAKPLIQ